MTSGSPLLTSAKRIELDQNAKPRRPELFDLDSIALDEERKNYLQDLAKCTSVFNASIKSIINPIFEILASQEAELKVLKKTNEQKGKKGLEERIDALDGEILNHQTSYSNSLAAKDPDLRCNVKGKDQELQDQIKQRQDEWEVQKVTLESEIKNLKVATMTYKVSLEEVFKREQRLTEESEKFKQQIEMLKKENAKSLDEISGLKKNREDSIRVVEKAKFELGIEQGKRMMQVIKDAELKALHDTIAQIRSEGWNTGRKAGLEEGIEVQRQPTKTSTTEDVARNSRNWLNTVVGNTCTRVAETTNQSQEPIPASKRDTEDIPRQACNPTSTKSPDMMMMMNEWGKMYEIFGEERKRETLCKALIRWTNYALPDWLAAADPSEPDSEFYCQYRSLARKIGIGHYQPIQTIIVRASEAFGKVNQGCQSYGGVLRMKIHLARFVYGLAHDGICFSRNRILDEGYLQDTFEFGYLAILAHAGQNLFGIAQRVEAAKVAAAIVKEATVHGSLNAERREVTTTSSLKRANSSESPVPRKRMSSAGNPEQTPNPTVVAEVFPARRG